MLMAIYNHMSVLRKCYFKHPECMPQSLQVALVRPFMPLVATAVVVLIVGSLVSCNVAIVGAFGPLVRCCIESFWGLNMGGSFSELMVCECDDAQCLESEELRVCTRILFCDLVLFAGAAPSHCASLLRIWISEWSGSLCCHFWVTKKCYQSIPEVQTQSVSQTLHVAPA